jgi:hypothetical protein
MVISRRTIDGKTSEEARYYITNLRANAENFSILKRRALNLLRLDPDTKTSLKGKRRKAG